MGIIPPFSVDKPVFSRALGIWHPFVMTDGAKNTPRISKRFKNRVRYLAMRQRASGMPYAASTSKVSAGER